MFRRRRPLSGGIPAWIGRGLGRAAAGTGKGPSASSTTAGTATRKRLLLGGAAQWVVSAAGWTSSQQRDVHSGCSAGSSSDGQHGCSMRAPSMFEHAKLLWIGTERLIQTAKQSRMDAALLILGEASMDSLRTKISFLPD